jgi:hypothetical protein
LIGGRSDRRQSAGQQGLKHSCMKVTGTGEINVYVWRGVEEVQQRLCLLDRTVAEEGDAVLLEVDGQGRKPFFSEEKKQKTFISTAQQTVRSESGCCRARDEKSLLVLFFRKEHTSYQFRQPQNDQHAAVAEQSGAHRTSHAG